MRTAPIPTHVRLFLLVAVAVFLQSGRPAVGQGGTRRSVAADLMKRRLYADAMNTLTREIKERPEAECGPKFVMLGECHYLQGSYKEARPWFAKALRFLPDGKNKTVAEYRLACTAFRLGDVAGAFERSADFVRKHPGDRRSGTLLLFRMKALAKRGKSAESSLEAVRRLMAAKAAQYGAAANLSADKILTDFYLANDLEDKAVSGYMRIVQDFRNVSSQYGAEKRTVPAAMEEARDYAAMQLARIALASNNHAEAVKWLGSIRFDQGLEQRARLLLAQIAYRQQDYRKAERYLLDGGFIRTVPPGQVRSDMYLLLGFCAKRARQPTMEQVFKYLRNVEPDSTGYGQAQMGMADTAARWRRPDLSTTHYERACASPKYEPEALAKLATLYLQMAEEEEDAKKKDAFLELAADRLSKLATKYQGSTHARGVKDQARALLAKGKVVKAAVSDEDMITEWERVVEKVPGSAEATRALASVARLHQRAVLDEKTGAFVKAPDYVRCREACDRLLDETVFKGAGLSPEFWSDIQAETLYYRGLCHVASVGQSPGAARAKTLPKYLPEPDIQAALSDLRSAGEKVGEKQLELAKNIETALLEAMFKSGEQELREQAEKRFHALVQKYGNEQRFRKLALEIAEWHHDQKNYVEAARMYEGVVERGGADAAQDEIVKLLFMAGKLYSKAAQDALKQTTDRSYAIHIHPSEVVRLGGLIASHNPLKKSIRVEWPEGELTAEEVLRRVSAASGIPFVWIARGGKAPVAAHLSGKRAPIAKQSGTVAEFLRMVLDPEKHELAFDIGLTDMAPTVDAAAQDESGPEARDSSRVLEIVDRSDWAARYGPMTRQYGTWKQLHRGSTMIYTVLERVQELSGARAQWAEGVSEEDALAREYSDLPGVGGDRSHSCATVLASVLKPLGLAYRIVPRDVATELYEDAKECFNEIRRISPKTMYGEQSLFLLALNYYHRHDYERMKIILQEYLKVFDSPGFDHHHQACFWVGWVFEREKRYRDACKYYNRAAEEALVIHRPPDGAELPTAEQLAQMLSYDTKFALDEPVSGTLTNANLQGSLQEFVRLNTGVEIAIDPPVAALVTNVNYGSFDRALVFDVLRDILTRMGLSFRPENTDKSIAEKAYYRMAACYKNDGLDEQALAACRCLLDRYPKTRRRRDAYKLQLDIFKALKDYRSVLATLGSLRSELTAEGQAYKIDYEIGWVYLDLCRYEEAATHFKQALAAARETGERVKMRDGLARALARAGSFADALSHYRVLVKEEPEPLRAFVARMMAWYLERADGKQASDELPPEASKLMRAYESLTDAQRGVLSRSVFAKITWVYYITALVDILRGDPDRALAKLDAAGNSPDDWLAAESILRAAGIHRKAGRTDAAKESLDYLLFSTKSAEAEVQALYELAACHRALGEGDMAEARLNRLIQRFPDSSYALAVKEERRKKAEREAAATNQVVEAGEASGDQ